MGSSKNMKIQEILFTNSNPPNPPQKKKPIIELPDGKTSKEVGEENRYYALMWLYRWGASTAEIINATGSGNNTRLTARLLKTGWIKTIPNFGRRKKLYALTDKGETYIAEEYRTMKNHVGEPFCPCPEYTYRAKTGNKNEIQHDLIVQLRAQYYLSAPQSEYRQSFYLSMPEIRQLQYKFQPDFVLLFGETIINGGFTIETDAQRDFVKLVNLVKNKSIRQYAIYTIDDIAYCTVSFEIELTPKKTAKFAEFLEKVTESVTGFCASRYRDGLRTNLHPNLDCRVDRDGNSTNRRNANVCVIEVYGEHSAMNYYNAFYNESWWKSYYLDNGITRLSDIKTPNYFRCMAGWDVTDDPNSRDFGEVLVTEHIATENFVIVQPLDKNLIDY